MYKIYCLLQIIELKIDENHTDPMLGENRLKIAMLNIRDSRH